MSKKRLAIIGLIILALIFYIDSRLRKRDEKPLDVGKIYVMYMLLGDKDQMVSLVGNERLKKKIISSNIQALDPKWEEYRNDAWDRLELFKVERLGDEGSLIATYAVIDPSVTDKVYIYTVILAPIGKLSLWNRSIGRLFISENNIPTPKWAVIDYYTDSDINKFGQALYDYYQNYSISRMSEENFNLWADRFEKHIDQIMEKEKKHMKLQNEEVKEYLKSYVKDHRDKRLDFMSINQN